MRVVGGFCGGGFGFEGVEGFSEGLSDDASCVADGDEFFAVCENGLNIPGLTSPLRGARTRIETSRASKSAALLRVDAA